MSRSQTAEKTYHDFYCEVNALGTWEYQKGFCGAHIAIIGENSYEWLLAFCSIVNGGNIVVPIDNLKVVKYILKTSTKVYPKLLQIKRIA